MRPRRPRARLALPIAASDGTFRLDREPDPRGFALRQDGRLVGHLPWHHQELVMALGHLDVSAEARRCGRDPRSRACRD